jgi:hypothetical protein
MAVTEDIIEHSFKACGISSNLDGSDDHMLHDRLLDAFDARENEEVLANEALQLLFDDEGDSEEEFEGFNDDEHLY